MHIGIGLPTSTPGGDGSLLTDWARRADEGPFSSLGVIDRIVYRSHDPLTSLAAAAAVTRRIRLCTMIVIGPLRNTTLLAKQAASIDQLSGGRLTLGLSIGARREDYDAVGARWSRRGHHLSQQLAELRDIWETARSADDQPRDSHIGPAPAQPDGPELLVGGLSGASFLRAARYADGYVHGGGPPRAFAGAANRARAAWLDAGRPGEPVLWGQSYFALGDAAAGEAYMRDYYGFAGAFAEKIAAGLLTSPTAIREQIRGYEEGGCHELVLLPATSDPAELDRLADIVG
ncbi:MAG TPA: LLM class flavin-dependent oxidoreductase [Nitriliruptorales bacterium]|nr:LLM class flavin-dependent oxidoreductase [Nitriliruptorales bacterium]